MEESELLFFLSHRILFTTVPLQPTYLRGLTIRVATALFVLSAGLNAGTYPDLLAQNHSVVADASAGVSYASILPIISIPPLEQLNTSFAITPDDRSGFRKRVERHRLLRKLYGASCLTAFLLLTQRVSSDL
jgi:hypothetical protein